MAAAITGGALVGSIAGVPAVSGAQETTEAPAPEATTDTATEAPRHRPGGPGHAMRGMKLEAAAEAIGITEEELREQLRGGATLAEVAEANGVDRQAVVDALVAAGNEQLDELRASLPERMEELMDRSAPTDREEWRERRQERREERREAEGGN